MYIHFVDFGSLVVHEKFQNHGICGFEEEYGNIWTEQRQPWLCDQDHFNTIWSQIPKESPYEIWP